eukprot:scaffold4109_cov101-Skeletonema_dohrnii-CCMP3373.AAC.2
MTNADEEIIHSVSIGSGEMKRQPSWSDINSLIGRIETLEQEREDEHIRLVNASEGVTAADDIDDFKDNHVPSTDSPTLRRRTSSRRGILARLMKRRQDDFDEEIEEVEHKFDDFELPDSTFTFLIAEPILSSPFAMACATYAMCLTCLALALSNELDNGTDDNPYDIAEVTRNVRAVQFLGIIIGVLMDDEIPTGLELIGMGLEQKKDGDKHYSMSRIFFSSLLRISIGMMFLTCLFFVVIQESNVLDIFFDVLALEFVESIDDVIYELCRRGFFSRRLKIAANQDNVIQCSDSADARRIRKWSKRVIRFVYFSVMFIMCAGLSIITYKQPTGEYGCTSIVVQFGDEVWEDAWITTDFKCSDDSDCNANQKCFQGNSHETPFCHEKRLLIFSHFNGLYTFDGIEAERPKYVEMNKEKGDPFKSTIPAEIKYCKEIESWVFFHPNIQTTLDSKASNECQWLLRSEETEDFDLVELSTGFWRLWDGKVVDDYRIDIDCAECVQDSDCNYMGTCVDEPGDGLDQKCECFDGFETPCDVIRSEKDNNTTLNIVKDLDQDGDSITFVSVYGRPIYSAKMQGKPYSLMRDGYPGQEEQYFAVEYPVNASVAVAPHKHNEPDQYDDDDFFEINNQSVAFQTLMKNYTFLLRYTGSRWYGQIIDPNLSSNSFKEEEYHAFWMNSFSGTGQEDNSTLIISEATTMAHPAGVDFFEMRRRNKVFEGGVFDYDYSQYGVLIPLVAHDGAGFFHCNIPSE